MRRFLKDDGSEKTIRKELGLREDDFVFVFVGRLAKEKNVGELLDLMEQDMGYTGFSLGYDFGRRSIYEPVYYY